MHTDLLITERSDEVLYGYDPSTGAWPQHDDTAAAALRGAKRDARAGRDRVHRVSRLECYIVSRGRVWHRENNDDGGIISDRRVR